MTAVLVPILIVVVLVVIAAVAVKELSSSSMQQGDRLQAPGRPTLRYLVPPGQDPAVVLTALRNEGYDASPESEPGPSSPVVIVGSRDGDTLDREQVRAFLEDLDRLNVNPEEDARVSPARVRFVDE